MSYHEFFLDGVKRKIIVVDPDDAMDKLVQWSHCFDSIVPGYGYVDPTNLTVEWHSPDEIDRRYRDSVAHEILLLLSSISNGETRHCCAVCDTRFSLARLPLRFISCWPFYDCRDMTAGSVQDGDTWGLCSVCSVRPTLLWADALVVFERKRIEHCKKLDEFARWLRRAKRPDEDGP